MHRDVVLAHRVVVERLAVHVHDEPVAHGGHRIAGGVEQHPGGVDRDVALRVGQDLEDRSRLRLDGPLDFHALSRHRRILPRSEHQLARGLDPELGDPGLRADGRVGAVGRLAVAVHPLVGGDGRGDPGVPDVGDAGVDLLLGDLVLLVADGGVGRGPGRVEGGVDGRRGVAGGVEREVVVLADRGGVPPDVVAVGVGLAEVAASRRPGTCRARPRRPRPRP